MKDSLKQSSIPKTAHVIFTQRGEMRNGLTEVIANKPTVRDVGFNLFDGLTHGANTKKALNKRNFNKNNRINARAAVILTVNIPNHVIDETKIDGVFDFADQMIYRYKLVQGDHGNLRTSFVTGFSQHIQALPH